MSEELKEVVKSKSEKEFDAVKYWVPRVAIFVFASMLIFYLWRFQGGLGGNNEFGTFGDFMGGFLNPILTFLTILLLVYSITFQLEELKETREEIRRSREDISHSNQISEERNQLQLSIFSTERICEELESADLFLEAVYGEDVITPSSRPNQTFGQILIKGDSLQTVIHSPGYRPLYFKLVFEIAGLLVTLTTLCHVIENEYIKADLFRIKLITIHRKLTRLHDSFTVVKDLDIFETKVVDADKEFLRETMTDLESLMFRLVTISRNNNLGK